MALGLRAFRDLGFRTLGLGLGWFSNGGLEVWGGVRIQDFGLAVREVASGSKSWKWGFTGRCAGFIVFPGLM